MTTILRRAYPLPDYTRNWDDLMRALHRDIAAMSDDELVSDRTLAAEAYAQAVANRSHAVVYLPGIPAWLPAVDWLKVRVQRLDAEISRRRKARR